MLLSVSELFSRQIVLQIPIWQRDYSWDDDVEVNELLSDLNTFATSKEPSYLLGSIITYPTKLGTHALVDGQQRTVTLYLLILAIRDNLRNKIEKESENSSTPVALSRLFSVIDSLCFSIPLSGSNSILLPIDMEFGKGNEIFQALALGRIPVNAELTNSQHNILNSYSWCRDFTNKVFPTAEELAYFANCVINGVFLVETHVGDEKRARGVFFKINYRGKPLENADLLKNFLFQELDEEQFGEVSTQWAKMSQVLRSSGSSQGKVKTPEFFLRNLAIIDSGEKIAGEDGVFEYWSDKYKVSNIAESENSELFNFVKNLQTRAEVFSNITSGKTPDGNVHNENIEIAEFFKGTQYLPALMAGSHLRHYEYLSGLVAFRYFLYTLLSERPQDFESLIPKWAKAISKLPERATKDEIDEITRSVRGLKRTRREIREVIESLTIENKYTSGVKSGRSGEKKIRAVMGLVGIDAMLRQGFHQIDLWIGLLDYSHKFRRRSKKGFDLDLILNSSEIDKLINEMDENQLTKFYGIGNIALINNQAKFLQNKLPSSKEEYYMQDSCPLTASLTARSINSNEIFVETVAGLRSEGNWNIYDWNIHSVDSRSEVIMSRFMRLLPTPLIDEN